MGMQKINAKTRNGEQPGNPVAEVFLTKIEVARLLRRTTRTIENWVRSGRLPSIKLGERTILFDRETVLQAIRAHQVGGTVLSK
jgi:excisionase family DNA binding protein